ERFSAQGPNDRRGRSLRQFDLERRLMRYPCSYMVYSEAFDALPPAAKDAVYHRMAEVLETRPAEDRRNIIEILRDTKSDLPAYFKRIG
ncbi:MAG TPA: hypothetical protein VKR43_17730, partial [Bryobacteraceae bacterium]|nr:hypothetical protein [Bryobacteraceae bacterium]